MLQQYHMTCREISLKIMLKKLHDLFIYEWTRDYEANSWRRLPTNMLSIFFSGRRQLWVLISDYQLIPQVKEHLRRKTFSIFIKKWYEVCCGRMVFSNGLGNTKRWIKKNVLCKYVRCGTIKKILLTVDLLFLVTKNKDEDYFNLIQPKYNY